MKTLAILGSTGSIGRQTLAVCDRLGMKIAALAAGTDYKQLADQVRKYKPRLVCMYNEESAKALRLLLAGLSVRIVSGAEGLDECAAASADVVVNALVGSVGLLPTMTAIRAGKDIALANKEVLVAAGELVMAEAAKHGVKILPVDSEHSAIWQCLQGNEQNAVRRIILTASGGAFRDFTKSEIEQKTAADALRHPNWNMGAKITIDCATMMNKGLEFIEAMHLFGTPPENIDIWLHRESIVHSMVEFEDGCIMAQCGAPDMQLPIQYALTYPKRLPLSAVGDAAHGVPWNLRGTPCTHGTSPCTPGTPPCTPGTPPCTPGTSPCTPGTSPCTPGTPPCTPGTSPCTPGTPRAASPTFPQLTFDKPDFERFPCLGLALQAAKIGGTLPAVMNKVNEHAVAAYMAGEIGFYDIARRIERAFETYSVRPADSVEAVLEAEGWVEGEFTITPFRFMI